jgi:hypothetical protein
VGRLRLLGALVLCACGGSTVVDPDSQGGASGSAGNGAGTGGAGAGGGGGGSGGVAGATATVWDGVPASDIPSPESLCAQKEQTILSPCVRADHEALLVGRWWMCSGTSPVPDPAAVGVEFASEGDWYGLVQAPDGSLQRDSGFDGQGGWELLENTGCAHQLNFNLSNGTIFAFPTFADQPRKMLLGTGGDGEQPRYAAIP